MGNVWRADRPQRGRYRQFMQCDIDILGEPSNLAEIELILATTTTLGRLGFKGFQIRINDRRILKAMAAYCGFAEEAYDSVFITLDKMDKIGPEGVKKSFLRMALQQKVWKNTQNFLQSLRGQRTAWRIWPRHLKAIWERETAQSLQEIVSSVKATKMLRF